jgi:hypothetical protein
MFKRGRGAWRLAVAAAAALTAIGGCSNDSGEGGDSGSTAVTTAPGASAVGVADKEAVSAPTVPGTVVAPTATQLAGPLAPEAAAALLTQSLDALAGGYHFSTSATLDGAEVLVAEGDRVGDGSRLTIWANGSSVAYIITPAGSWVFPEGGEWQSLDEPPASVDPLAALRTPTVVSGTSDGTTSTVVVNVPAASLGVAAEGNVDVTVTITGTAATAVSYAATLEGRPANVRTTLGPVVDGTPVVAPI